MANYPRVEMQNIDKLSISFKKGVARISFEVLPSHDMLKLIYLQGTTSSLNAVIESPQAEMDLQITPINLKSGEVMA